MKEKLFVLKTILQQKHPLVVPYLLPPDKDFMQMNQKLSEVIKGYKLPDDLTAMYTWMGGTEIKYEKIEHFVQMYDGSEVRVHEDTYQVNGICYLFPSYYLMSFKEALTHFNEKNNIFKYKKEYYFPFLHSGSGIYLSIKLVSTNNNNIKDKGIYMAIKPRSKVHGNYLNYKNMDVLLDAIIECYDQDVYYENQFGEPMRNIFKETEICYRLTPNSSKWYLRKFGKLLEI